MANRSFKKIKVNNLELGMYVHIPIPWYDHPFLTNQFAIKSQEDLASIKELGLQEVEYDPAQSTRITAPSQPPAPSTTGGEESDPAFVWQRKIVSELASTVRDQRIPPVEKARIVKQHSFTMMQNLLEYPTEKNIGEAKKGISSVVNLILNDNDTLRYLLDITSHDYYTYTHSVEVGILGVALAKSVFQDSRFHDIHALGAGFFLHDLGKTQIDQAIINKPGKLTGEEMTEMRRHSVLGYQMLLDANQLTEESKTILLHHHERMDGSGYPKGLNRDQIPLYGRICTIADIYDALITNRSYRRSMKPFEALKLMQKEMSGRFQQKLFKEFVFLLLNL